MPLPALPPHVDIPPDILAKYPTAIGYDRERKQAFKLDKRGRRHWLGRRGTYKEVLKGVVALAHANDIALLILNGFKRMKDLVRESGLSRNQIERILQSDELREAIDRVHGEHYEALKDRTKARGLAPLYRQQLLREKGQELLAHTLEQLQMRIERGDARATELKVAVEAAFGSIDRDPQTAIKMKGGNMSVHADKAIILSPEQAKAIAAANDEAGTDMADVLEGVVVEDDSAEA